MVAITPLREANLHTKVEFVELGVVGVSVNKAVEEAVETRCNQLPSTEQGSHETECARSSARARARDRAVHSE